MNPAQPSYEDLPSTNQAPPAAEPSRLASVQAGMSRRQVLRAVTGVAVASGLGLLDLFPWSRPRVAEAAAYEQWSDCRGYFNASTVCVPSSAYYGRDNCSGSWHKQFIGNGCIAYRYTHDPSSCSGRNAWRWTGRTARRKCSDGWYWFRDCTDNTIVSRFSICRTAI